MGKSIFPLSWESTGGEWWYATPIDWAAANGLIDLVKQLLRADPNLLIKLTSLARIRRLETVWDDDLHPGYNVAQCRARVARSLLLDCESKSGDGEQKNTLIRAGYGGWLLYTATSAGDVLFVKDLLERDPISVFGGGEYGITDILYGAARSRNSEVFRMVIQYAMSVNKGNFDANGNFGEEIMSRAVHSSARGGNLEILKEILLECSNVSGYRDGQGYTILHSAAGKGQVEVVNYLIKKYDILNITDNQGNTALHVAAFKGRSSVVEILALASPLLATSTNNDGNTFLHMTVNGFQSRGFHRIDQQMDLMKKLVSNKIINLENIINITNKVGKTALHIAVSENIQCIVLELLMTVPSVELNICDIDGYTPMGLLKQCRKTASSEILIKPISRNANFRQLTIHGIGTSPGTSFRLPDPDLLSFTGDENESDISCGLPSSRLSSCSSELTTTHFDSSSGIDISTSSKKSVSTNSPSKTFKSVFGIFDRRKSRQEDDKHISLRQRFSKKGVFPSHSTREKFAASLMHGVIQAKVQKSGFSSTPFSSSTPYLESLVSPPDSVDKVKGEIVQSSINRRSNFFSGPLDGERSDDNHRRVSSFSKSLMNQYFCFGAHGLAVQVEDSVSYKGPNRTCSRRLVF